MELQALSYAFDTSKVGTEVGIYIFNAFIRAILMMIFVRFIVPSDQF